jgi:hypothetical protein
MQKTQICVTGPQCVKLAYVTYLVLQNISVLFVINEVVGNDYSISKLFYNVIFNVVSL